MEEWRDDPGKRDQKAYKDSRDDGEWSNYNGKEATTASFTGFDSPQVCDIAVHRKTEQSNVTFMIEVKLTYHCRFDVMFIFLQSALQDRWVHTVHIVIILRKKNVVNENQQHLELTVSKIIRSRHESQIDK